LAQPVERIFPMALIHVDERDGSDITGQGSPESPYQSLAFALYTHGLSTQTVIRKDSSSGYEEPTPSSLKKAKKGAEGIEKKKKKQEELAQRDLAEKREERERKEKLLESSRQIVLVEDPALPKAVRVRDKLVHISRTNIF
jgi:asparaginyl-tRNA synthetase